MAAPSLARQVRERYINHLDPTIKRGPFLAFEVRAVASALPFSRRLWGPPTHLTPRPRVAQDRVIWALHAAVGARWAEIAKSLPGRTENSVKNRFYAAARKVGGRRRYVPQEGGLAGILQESSPVAIASHPCCLRHRCSLRTPAGRARLWMRSPTTPCRASSRASTRSPPTRCASTAAARRRRSSCRSAAHRRHRWGRGVQQELQGGWRRQPYVQECRGRRQRARRAALCRL